MWTTKESGNYTIKLKNLVTGILLHNRSLTEQNCHTSVIWKVNRSYGSCSEWSSLLSTMPQLPKSNMKYSLYLKDIHNIRISDDLVQSNCIAELNMVENQENEKKDSYEILVTFVKGKAAFINITELKTGYEEQIYKIRSCNEDCYLVEETKVIYIEASHNQVLWHCTNGIITSNNSLGHLEAQVSESFVRIQRGYLVNKYHVRHIRRCEVQMSNGDVLSIPSKKYVTVREKLFK